MFAEIVVAAAAEAVVELGLAQTVILKVGFSGLWPAQAEPTTVLGLGPELGLGPGLGRSVGPQSPT